MAAFKSLKCLADTPEFLIYHTESCKEAAVANFVERTELASHAGVFRSARISSLPTKGTKYELP